MKELLRFVSFCHHFVWFKLTCLKNQNNSKTLKYDGVGREIQMRKISVENCYFHLAGWFKDQNYNTSIEILFAGKQGESVNLKPQNKEL